ncbi:alpha-tocopherol transfer protein-like isoform X1 [Microplitis mediator]|uniref:alpha-tocopherol transfer protein-like isoform X1 n=1 Tax=Microplitis mediator TaxID=375433 RepID=UPI0025530E99|nr:alpha-tocopherol transfer protein-like isoform X1 [Microplitis mediator]XP_057342255.1 alpha-tocopherol transfer protein-like isoform X1 [Microplitis mediator]XP_057342256.1 alpha-tocopherol transfer protein-like isoform X1 [Microplitis mediator]
MNTMKLGHTIEDSRKNYPELTKEILDELRVWIAARGVTQVPDEKLALFAHSCYFDLEAAKKCMTVYYKLRATVPEFFSNRDPRAEYLQHSLRALQFVSLPKRDQNGNQIIFHRLADTRPNQYMFDDGIKLLQMSVDASLYNEGCAPGYIFLFDMQGVRLGHLTRLSITSIRRFFEYLQEGLPVRLKGIHVLNAVWFMDKVLALIRPFMKRELFDNLHLYTGDVAEIYSHIPPECLPKDFGGELDSLETLHEQHCEKLYKLRDYFLEEERLFRGWQTPEKKSSPSDSEVSDINASVISDNNVNHRNGNGNDNDNDNNNHDNAK